MVHVATRNWWPGKNVIVSPKWIVSLNWEASRIVAGLTREAIQTAPEYDESAP
jgi:hypothetical protein